MNIDSTLEVAKGISEFGILSIIAGFYLVTTFISHWKQTKRQEKILEKAISLLQITVDNTKSISEGIKEKTYQQAQTYGKACIENTMYKLLIEADRIKEENNLTDKDSVKRKVYTVALNLYNERSNLFDGFYYKGKKLMEYTDTEWVKMATDSIIDSIYDEDYSRKKLYYNLNMTYNEIVHEFLKNLIK